MSISPLYLLLGAGYTLTRVASLLPAQLTLLTTTTPEKMSAFQADGFTARLLDYRDSQALADFFHEYPDIEVIVDSVPPRSPAPPPGGADYELIQRDAWVKDATLGVRNLVAHLQSTSTRVRRVVYLSTTGVYGVTDGSEVNEETPTLATEPRALARIESENCYRSLAAQTPIKVTTVRIPAIHGPGRGPGRGLAEALRRGTYPLIDDGMRWTNRIEVSHLAALIKVLIAAPAGESLPPIINATDGNPRRAIEAVSEICKHQGLPLPTSISAAEAKRRGLHTLLGNQRVVTLYPNLVASCNCSDHR